MSPFLQLILALIIIITGAKAGGWLANRLRQPAVLGELLVGLLLGPNDLAWDDPREKALRDALYQCLGRMR